MSKMVRATVTFPPIVVEILNDYLKDYPVDVEDLVEEKIDELMKSGAIAYNISTIEVGLKDTITDQGYGYTSEDEYVDFDDDEYENFEDGGFMVSQDGIDITDQL